MRRTITVAICLLAAMLGLAACQSSPTGRSLGPERIAALQQAGFIQSDEGWEFSASEKLLFGSNEATLVPTARQTVARIARLLIDLEISAVRVDGHTDTTGGVAYNDQLSLRRAQAVAEAMAAAGMSAANIMVRGLGSRAPVTSNQTLEGRAQNRRVVLVIVGT